MSGIDRARERWGSARVHREPPRVDGRVPRHNLDAEAAVLSACLLDPSRVPSVLHLMGSGDAFFSDSNRILWQSVERVHERREAVDLATVVADVRDRQLLAKAGGVGYAARILDATPAVANVVDHARIVHRLWLVRRAVAECQRIAAEGYGDVGDAPTWLGGASAALRAIADESATREGVTAAEAAWEGIDAAVERMGRQGLDLSTGMVGLDMQTAGFHPGDLIMLTAETGGGKTALGSQLATVVALQRRGAMVFSAEQTRAQFAMRMACARARVDSMRLRRNEHTAADIDALQDAHVWLRSLPILVDDERKLSISKLRAKATKAAAQFERAGTPIGLVVVDYLQKLRGRELVGPRETRALEIEKMSEALFHLSEDLSCSVLCLAQENAAGQVRDSRGAEFEATCVWQLRGVKSDEGGDRRPVTINITKQRKGPHPVRAHAHFQPSLGLFTPREEWE